jgi:hypothetical protein
MFHQRSLRRFAATVLLVWLFGLASGIVNACVVSAGVRSDAGTVATVDRDAVVMAPEAAAILEHHAAGHDHGAKSIPPACERLCEAPPAAPQQAEKQAGNHLSGLWLAAAPVPSMVLHVVARTSVPLPRAEPERPAAVPISIAFLRLAL